MPTCQWKPQDWRWCDRFHVPHAHWCASIFLPCCLWVLLVIAIWKFQDFFMFFSILSVARPSFLPYFIPLMRPSVSPLLWIYVGAGFLKRLIINSLLKIASFFMKEKILERIKYCTMADVKKVMPHVSTRTFDWICAWYPYLFQSLSLPTFYSPQ